MKKVKIAIFSLLGVAVLFFAVLLVHIVIMVKNRPPVENATIQMARADFNEPIDATAATKIQNEIKEQPGVKSTYFNSKTNILVYTFDNRDNDAQDIYNKTIKNSGFASVRKIYSAEESKTGCPVMDNNSFYGKLTKVVTSIVN